VRRRSPGRAWAHLAGLASIAILSWSADASAQSDVELWTSAGVRVRPSQPVRLDVDIGLRFDENVSRLDSVLPELGASYDPTEWLRLGVGYRFYWERNGAGDFEAAHRIHVEASFEVEAGDLSFSYRLRFQEKIDNNNNHVLRNRLGAEWDTDTVVTPFLTAELFTALGDGQAVKATKWRGTVGASFDVDEHNIDVFYRFELPIDDPNDPTLHIIGLEYRYELRLYDRED
jgi:hypothetical protein